ncbi:MAG TPA: hypothetical protein VKD70_08395 [Candidatus Acidoferrum sp.]|nr:hypothetical protein [Candidatus Acidoferrum sp.]
MNHARFGLSGEQKLTTNLMRRTIFAATLGTFLFAASFLLASCGSQTGAGQHGTILMRDGTTLSGTITSTSASEITLTADDTTKHTIPMAQVKSIEYDDAPAAQTAAGQPSPGGNAASPSGGSSAGSGSSSGGGGATHKRSSASKAKSDAVHEEHYHPTQDEIQTKTYVLGAGTKVAVRTEETIDSAKAVEGQTFAAEIADDVVDSDGNVVVPRGANAQIVIRSASKGGRFKGTSDLVLDLQSIAVGGKEYLVSTTDLTQKGKQGFGVNKRTGEFTGGGAALGAIIGAIAGGGKGAAIGAGAGAGAGAVTQIATKGGAIKVPAETVLTFQLDKAVKIVEAR